MTTREFAARLLQEAAKPDSSAAVLQSRQQVRLIEHALHEAVKMQLEVGFTPDHLDAVLAVMRTTSILKSSLRDYVPADVTGWEDVLIEVLRINLHGTDPPQPARSNLPNMQQMPRTKSFNRPIQASAADRAVGGALIGALGGAALGAVWGMAKPDTEATADRARARAVEILAKVLPGIAPVKSCAACNGLALLHTCGPSDDPSRSSQSHRPARTCACTRCARSDTSWRARPVAEKHYTAKNLESGSTSSS